MLTRLQLANGYVAGTLTKEEKEAAECNPVVMRQVKTLMDAKESKPTYTRRIKKNG